MCFNLKREISFFTPIVGIVHGITLLFDKWRIMGLQYPTFQVAQDAQKLLVFGPEASVTHSHRDSCLRTECPTPITSVRTRPSLPDKSQITHA